MDQGSWRSVDQVEDRRVNHAMGVLLGWYVVLGLTAYGLFRALHPDTGLLLIAGPIAAVVVVIIAPVTLAVLAQGRHRLSAGALGTASAAAGLAALLLCVAVALAIR